MRFLNLSTIPLLVTSSSDIVGLMPEMPIPDCAQSLSQLTNALKEHKAGFIGIDLLVVKFDKSGCGDIGETRDVAIQKATETIQVYFTAMLEQYKGAHDRIESETYGRFELELEKLRNVVGKMNQEELFPQAVQHAWPFLVDQLNNLAKETIVEECKKNSKPLVNDKDAAPFEDATSSTTVQDAKKIFEGIAISLLRPPHATTSDWQTFCAILQRLALCHSPEEKVGVFREELEELND